MRKKNRHYVKIFLTYKCKIIFNRKYIPRIGANVNLLGVYMNLMFLSFFFRTTGFWPRVRARALRAPVFLKVHKHEIILNFFLDLNKSLYALGKFSKKISLLFLRFSPEFRSSNIFAVTEHTRNQFFLEFTVVLLDGFLKGFPKFRFFIVEICILIWDF